MATYSDSSLPLTSGTVEEDTDLTSMLEKGEIDAAFPQFNFWKTQMDRSKNLNIAKEGKVRLLFPNQKEESIRFYKKTRIFPINHTVVIRNDVLEKNPWVAVNIFEAYQKSKMLSYEKVEARMREPTNYVWLDDLVREVRDVFGDDPYPYGIRKNKDILDTITTYSFEQGLSPRKAQMANSVFPYDSRSIDKILVTSVSNRSNLLSRETRGWNRNRPVYDSGSLRSLTDSRTETSKVLSTMAMVV